MKESSRQTVIGALQLQRKLLDEQNPHTFVSEWRQELYNSIDAALADLAASDAQPQGEWENVPDGTYQNGAFSITLETPPKCSQAVVTHCSDSLGVVKSYIWIPKEWRIQRPKLEAD